MGAGFFFFPFPFLAIFGEVFLFAGFFGSTDWSEGMSVCLSVCHVCHDVDAVGGSGVGEKYVLSFPLFLSLSLSCNRLIRNGYICIYEAGQIRPTTDRPTDQPASQPASQTDKYCREQ